MLVKTVFVKNGTSEPQSIRHPLAKPSGFIEWFPDEVIEIDIGLWTTVLRRREWAVRVGDNLTPPVGADLKKGVRTNVYGAPAEPNLIRTTDTLEPEIEEDGAEECSVEPETTTVEGVAGSEPETTSQDGQQTLPGIKSKEYIETAPEASESEGNAGNQEVVSKTSSVEVESERETFKALGKKPK